MTPTHTKERILDVAECLFADSGFATTSLRDITTEAGVNLASVNYHFGSKEGLLLAVLDRRFGPVNQRRLERLDELEQATNKKGPALEDILRAFFIPPFEMRTELGENGDKFVRLLGRVHTETNDDFRKSFIEQFDLVFCRFADSLTRALPSLEPSELRARMWFLVGAMAYTMMWGDTMCTADKAAGEGPDELIESLIRFGAAGLLAPSTTSAGARVARTRRRLA